MWPLLVSAAFALQCPPGTQQQKAADPPQIWCASPDGQKQGPYESRYPNGQIRTQAHYTRGVPDGAYAKYTEEGRLAERGTHKGGKMHGKWEHFDDDGGLKDQTLWREGVPDGPFEFFHNNGKKKTSGTYRSGELSGKWTEWDSQGGVLASGEYQCGNRTGSWTVRRESGSAAIDYGSSGCAPAIDLRLFRGEFVAGFDGSGLALTTGALGWVPRIQILSWLALRPHLGASVIKIESGTRISVGFMGDAWIEAQPFSWLRIGAGPGLQFIAADSVITLGAGGYLSVPIHWRALPFFKALTLTNTVVFASPSSFNWVTLGADIRI